jgi:hypothetical protein
MHSRRQLDQLPEAQLHGQRLREGFATDRERAGLDGRVVRAGACIGPAIARVPGNPTTTPRIKVLPPTLRFM